jgi:DNA-binding NarL/FixJ family response regulator
MIVPVPLAAYIVEDHATLRESLAEALAELAGIATVGQTGDAKAAIAWLADPANAWDIAIVDLVLERGGHGSSVLKALRDRDPRRKVVVLTATADPQVRAQCLALGSDHVFDKAMETEALLEWCADLGAAR